MTASVSILHSPNSGGATFLNMYSAVVLLALAGCATASVIGINPNALNVPLDTAHVALAKNAQLIQQAAEGTRNILGGGIPAALPADTHEVAAGKVAHAIAVERQRATVAGAGHVIGGVVAPGVIGNGLIGNGLVAPGVIGNGLVAPGLIGNGLVAPGVIGNGLVAPGVIGNGLVAPGLIGNGVVASGVIGNGLIGHGLVNPWGLGLGSHL